MTTESFKTVVLRAAADHYLTQSADVDIIERMVVTVICLGRNDSAENYREITKEEGDAILAEQNQARKEEQPND